MPHESKAVKLPKIRTCESKCGMSASVSGVSMSERGRGRGHGCGRERERACSQCVYMRAGAGATSKTVELAGFLGCTPKQSEARQLELRSNVVLHTTTCKRRLMGPSTIEVLAVIAVRINNVTIPSGSYANLRHSAAEPSLDLGSSEIQL